MYPGRPYLGFGSGEALNEVPLGHGWPSVGEQIERMEEALEMIRALWDGKKLSGEGWRGRWRSPARWGRERRWGGGGVPPRPPPPSPPPSRGVGPRRSTSRP